MKNKKFIISCIVVIATIGLIITFVVSTNMKSARRSDIAVKLTTVKGTTMYILGKVGVSTRDIQDNTVIDDDYVALVLYDSNNSWMLGIKLDKNANKINQIYGSEAKKCELLFREEFKNQLAPDFTVE